MDGTADGSADGEGLRDLVVPDRLGDGTTVLVAYPGNLAASSVCLRLLCRVADADDTALVVTTTASANRTLQTVAHHFEADETPAFGVVDTVSEQQSISAVYDETPVVFTPANADLERLVLALAELSGADPPARSARHLVVRSLTPLVEATSVSHVSSVLERVIGLRSDDGLCLLGLDYAAHDEATIAELARHVEGLLWVSGTGVDGLDLTFRPARAHLGGR